MGFSVASVFDFEFYCPDALRLVQYSVIMDLGLPRKMLAPIDKLYGVGDPRFTRLVIEWPCVYRI